MWLAMALVLHLANDATQWAVTELGRCWFSKITFSNEEKLKVIFLCALFQDNIILFLRGCKELGLKESQLFDPGDLQDTSNRVTVK